MFVYSSVCEGTCVCVLTCFWWYICLSTYMLVKLHMFVYSCTCGGTYVCVLMHLWRYVCLCTRVFVKVHVFVYSRACGCINVCVVHQGRCVHTYSCSQGTYMCVCE